MTLYGIEPATFRFEAQYLNHCATAVPDQLMWYRENLAVCSEVHTKHLNVHFKKNVDMLNVKPDGIYSNR
jgi:hypothetical protein